jgi:ABC-2 type transport system ATP-binding protein
MTIQVNGLKFDTGFNGVLGPRGVGKTRLLKQMALLNDAAAIGFSKKACYLTEEFGPLASLTVREYLFYMAGVKEIDKEQVVLRVQRTMEQLHLMRFADRVIGSLSRLVQTQTLVAKSLLDDPPYMLLDDVLEGLNEQERMIVGYALSEIAKDRTVVLAGSVCQAVEGLFDTVCMLHPEKGAVHVATNTAYEWVEGKVWEYVAAEVPEDEDGRLLAVVKRADDGVVVREIALQMPQEEVSQVTPTLEDAYRWWSVQH